MSVDADAILVQDWLGSRHPKLADELDRIQGLANLFGDIVEGIIAHIEAYDREPESLRPIARIGARGQIIIELSSN